MLQSKITKRTQFPAFSSNNPVFASAHCLTTPFFYHSPESPYPITLAMTRAVTAPRKSSRAPAKVAGTRPKPSVSKDYWTQSQLPLTCLAFLLTPIVIYELGTRYLTRQEIIASRLLQDFFNFFSATGPHLPALAVVGILLAMHIARNDRWVVTPRVLGLMALESLLLALPVIGISMLASHYIPHLPLVSSKVAMSTGPTKAAMIVLSCGAGIYEELVFRLIAFTLLNVLIVDLFQTRKQLSALLIVAIPAVLFSIYHYLGYEHFTFRSFVFRTLAGIYFGIVFLFRGFGITAGSHAAYDILIVLLT